MSGGVVVRAPGPLADYVERFGGVAVSEVSGYGVPDWQASCLWMREMTVARNLRYRFDPVLSTGVAYAARSPKAGDVWRWDAPVDIPDLDLTAANAVSLAVHRATFVPSEVPKFRSWLIQ